jgi:hypothetical protein
MGRCKQGQTRLTRRRGGRGILVDLLIYNSRVASMADPVEALILDLLEWIGPQERPYAEVIEAWRTSCPRLPVWEDANDRGFIEYHRAPGTTTMVAVSGLGASFLTERRRMA